MTNLIINFDGAVPFVVTNESTGEGKNICSFGYIIKDADTNEVISQNNGLVYDAQIHSNNSAEYYSLIRALETATLIPHKSAKIIGDSQLVIKQVNTKAQGGGWKCNKPHLVPLRDYARTLLTQMTNPTLTHVRGKFNKEADALSRSAK